MKRSLFIIGLAMAFASPAAAQTAYQVSGVAKCSAPAMIIFDNGKNSRIMNVVGSQKSMGFLADGGVSDMLCQILVQAQ